MLREHTVLSTSQGIINRGLRCRQRVTDLTKIAQAHARASPARNLVKQNGLLVIFRTSRSV